MSGMLVTSLSRVRYVCHMSGTFGMLVTSLSGTFVTCQVCNLNVIRFIFTIITSLQKRKTLWFCEIKGKSLKH